MTSIDLKRPQKIEFIKPVSNVDSVIACSTNGKTKLIGGSVHEINDEHLYGIHQINNKL